MGKWVYFIFSVLGHQSLLHQILTVVFQVLTATCSQEPFICLGSSASLNGSYRSLEFARGFTGMHKGAPTKIPLGTNHSPEAQAGSAIRSNFIEKRGPERRPYLRHPTGAGQPEVISTPEAEIIFLVQATWVRGALLAHSKTDGPVGGRDGTPKSVRPKGVHGPGGQRQQERAHSPKF